MKRFILAAMLVTTPAHANTWVLFACPPGYGPGGCIPLHYPATRGICIQMMDEIVKTQPKGTVMACTNGIDPPILPSMRGMQK